MDAASVAVRTAFDTRDVVQRIVEFLPFDEVCGTRSLHVGRARFESRIGRYFGRLGVKAACRGLRSGARQALTRGHWRPVCRLAHEGVALVRRFANKSPRSCPALLTEAWARDRGAVVLTLLTDRAWETEAYRAHPHYTTPVTLGSRYLQLVESDSRYLQHIELDRPVQTNQGLSAAFCRIMSAFGDAYALLRAGENLLDFLRGWLDWTGVDYRFGIPETYPIQNGELLDLAKVQIGRALEEWADPGVAAGFVAECTSLPWDGDPGPPYPLPATGWPPGNLIHYGRSMSQIWQDRAKARRFAGYLASVQRLREELPYVCMADGQRFRTAAELEEYLGLHFGAGPFLPWELSEPGSY
jgi:hypothetical protein